MIENPIDVLKQFPVRKSRKQKKAFRESVCSWFEKSGYSCCVEKGSGGSCNVVIGDPENAKHLITAHYDTCARLPFANFIMPCNFWLFMLYQLLLTACMLLPGILIAFILNLVTKNPQVGDIAFILSMLVVVFLLTYGPANPSNANDNTSGVVTLLEIAASMPEAYRNQVCFVLFDLEEAGLIGSASYRNCHKNESKHQLVWNLDCVGDGDEIVFFPSRKVLRNPEMMVILARCETQLATKSISVIRRGFRYFPSDQRKFPHGVGICALRRGKAGLYMGKIHTHKDTNLDETNVNILRAAIVSAISCQGVR